VLAFDALEGLAAVGFLTLAVTVTRYVDRADQVVTAAVFPAVCAIQGRTGALEELFAKTNRATLLWVVPFGAGLVLFAPDLVAVVLGEAWEPAVVLVQGLAVAGLLGQLGSNWFSFYRAHGQTRPQAVEAVAGAAAFVALAVPGLALAGSGGFVAGRIAAVLVALAVRAVYVRRLLPGVRLAALAAPVAVPALAAIGAAVAVRGVLWGGGRPLAQVALEVALFAGVFAAVAVRRERALLGELREHLRPADQGAGQDGGHERQGGHLPVPVDG
jgi:O-antigen/teichoic acid export membrane protein